MGLEAAIAWLRARHDVLLKDYCEALRIPTVSTLPEHKPDMFHMADWLATRMKGMGLESVEIMPTSGNPIVCGNRQGAPDAPTVLVYGHYDVQPADPLDEWESPPFEPALRDDHVVARGASDMKGQIFAQLAAVEAVLAQGDCPVNLKYLIEGDEEIGSPGLEAFIREHRERLACDVVLNCDSGIHGPDAPSLVYALRGLAYFELELSGPAKDLHSGMYGGTIRNPLHVLCALIAGMHDAEGRVTLPGFYDAVRSLDEEERAQLSAAPYSDEDWLRLCGARGLFGETGFTTMERVGARPSLDVNGIWGGFQGEGAKTVLPARAGAKLSMRLVADQRLDAVEEQLRAYLEAKMPEDCRFTLNTHSLGPGAIMDRKSPYMRAAARALETVFGRQPFFRREGASVPIVGMMQQLLGVDSVMLGFGLPDDGIHGPNERQSLPLLFKGMEAYVHFLHLVGAGLG